MSNQRQVTVWDPVVRIFHWTFAIAILGAWVSHEWRGSGRQWHEWLGYAALGLAIFRILWGFIGTKYARFSEFLHLPRYYLSYFFDLLKRKERRYLGHNPLGGLMVIALLLVALGTGITGHYLTDRSSVLLGLGHRAQEEVHEVLGNLFMILVPLHILGIIWESVRHKESLTKAMFTGKKRSN